jgi:hypothetical protein
MHTYEVIFEHGEGESKVIETRNVQADKVWYGQGLVVLLLRDSAGMDCVGLYPRENLVGLTILPDS